MALIVNQLRNKKDAFPLLMNEVMSHSFVAFVNLGEIKEMKTKLGGFRMQKCSLDHNTGFSLSKFILEDGGTPHHFTHAKTHRAGGFNCNERPSVVLFCTKSGSGYSH